VGVSKKKQKSRKSRILHEMGYHGYHVEKENLEEIQPLLAGKLVLGLKLLVQTFTDPGQVVTELWVCQFVTFPFEPQTARNNLPCTTVQLM
jgi:hypothetical protein